MVGATPGGCAELANRRESINLLRVDGREPSRYSSTLRRDSATPSKQRDDLSALRYHLTFSYLCNCVRGPSLYWLESDE